MPELRGFKLVVTLVLEYEKKKAIIKKYSFFYSNMQPLLYQTSKNLLNKGSAGIIDSVADDAFYISKYKFLSGRNSMKLPKE